MEVITAIIGLLGTLGTGAAAIVRADKEDRSRLVHLVIIGMVAAAVLWGIITFDTTDPFLSDLGHPFWWLAFVAVAFVAGLAGGGLLKAGTSALLPGGIAWLGGTLGMNYYSATGDAGETILTWRWDGAPLPWVLFWMVLLPVCAVLSYLAARLVTGNTPKAELL